jgi:hypothetical protein
MFGLIMINKEVKGIIMLGHQIQMFGLIMINKEVKRIIMLGHQNDSFYFFINHKCFTFTATQIPAQYRGFAQKKKFKTLKISSK